LQAPKVPHVDGGCHGHEPPGSVFAAAKPHVPSAPEPFCAAVHAVHVPVHALSQHTPSTQKPDWHSSPDAHGAASRASVLTMRPSSRSAATPGLGSKRE